MNSVTVNGNTFTVGQTVGFKSDTEQYGKITKITRSPTGFGYILHLSNPRGFSGDYLRYATETTESAADCWID